MYLGSAWVAVPAGWKEILRPNPRLVLSRVAEGVGLPAVDENGAPIQAELTVEKHPGTGDTLKEGAAGLVGRAKGTRGLELVGKEKAETVTLADGTEAALLTMEFIQGGTRRTLWMKLLAKDGAENGWVVSRYVIGGQDSKLPTRDRELVRWVRAHLTSFCFEKAKLDEDKLKKAHARYGKAKP